ncbi:MAG TPA: ATP-binding protein [Phycisphaerae bacterium]|nr:ATP-binding protein [Phycisphaerae bacterium]
MSLNDGFFSRVCEGLGFACIAMDRELKILFWNGQATREFSRSPEEMVGTPFLNILGETDREGAHRRILEVMDRQQHQDMEVRFPLPEGERKTFVLIISPIIGESGESIGATAGMRDITERKRQAQVQAQTRRMASLGRVAGAIAHHFNNILGGMLTSIDYVLASDSPRELRKTLRLLGQSIGRATRITNQLAAFAEAENELIEWQQINAIVAMFVERLKPKTDAARLHLVADLKPVESDRYEQQRLLTVLDSIAQNAIDAMVPDGTLTVALGPEGDNAVIRIRDSGCGIPEDNLEHLFEPFFTTKGELAGGQGENIGLGLAAVHGLVAEMGGTIRLKSKIGEGTEVTIRLPLRRKNQEVRTN